MWTNYLFSLYFSVCHGLSFLHGLEMRLIAFASVYVHNVLCAVTADKSGSTMRAWVGPR